jgi:hypothetical protein
MAGLDGCLATAPATIPTVFAVPAATGAARQLFPVMGATSDATVGTDGRSALYFTPVRRDAAGQDVYGLVRVRIEGGRDTLLHETPAPRFDAVDPAGRVVAFVAPAERHAPRDVTPDTLVAVDVPTRTRRAVRVLDANGSTVLGVAPDGSAALVRSGTDALVVRLADGTLLGRVAYAPRFDPDAGTSNVRLAATRWRTGGAVDLLVESDSGGYGNTWQLFDVVRFPEGSRARAARVRGVVTPFDWLADGSLVAWELARPDSAVTPLVPGGSPPTAGTLRRYAPGDTAGREVVRGVFRSAPAAVRGSPDGRSVAFATNEVVGVAPIR